MVRASAALDLDAGSRHRDALVVACAKAAVLAFVAYSGFVSLSDDDFARVAISEAQARTPRLDPSGTSWLPLPFYVDGALMAVFGRGLGVARASAATLAIASTLAVLVAARFIGVPRYGAVSGALIACAVPYASWLGLATIPDGWCHALIALGAASTVSDQVSRRYVGSLAITLAALGRYEAWPVALTIAGFAVLDGSRTRDRRLVGAAALALVGPALWIAHGAWRHADPVFFFTRVAEYHAAVGGSADSAVVRAFWFPLAFLRCEPELAAATLFAAGAAFTRGERGIFARHTRPAILAMVMVGGLSLGTLSGGAPTHHRERTLLSAWLLAAIFAGDALHAVWRSAGPRHRSIGVGAVTLLVGLAAIVVRPWYARRDGFVDRANEVAIGRELRKIDLAPADRIAIDSKDFGYFAVIASSGRPEQCVPLDDHDPRKAHEEDSLASADAAMRRLDSMRARYLVARTEHIPIAEQVGTTRARNRAFVLMERSGASWIDTHGARPGRND